MSEWTRNGRPGKADSPHEDFLPRHPLPLAAAFVLAFVAVAWVSGTGVGAQIDRYLLTLLQSAGEEMLPAGPAWMREAARDLTALGSISALSLATLSVCGWFVIQGRWRHAIVVAATVTGGVVSGFLLKLGFSQPRPDLVGSAPLVFTSSFPSSHAMSSLIVYMTLAVTLVRETKAHRLRRYWLVMAALASFVAGLSRVYLGVHWPGDVFAGWLAGAAWLMLCVCVIRRVAPSAVRST